MSDNETRAVKYKLKRIRTANFNSKNVDLINNAIDRIDQGGSGGEGVEGPTGPAGPKGSPGLDGLPGLDGSPGETGTTGLQGDPGIAGTPGTDGAKGDTGPAGPTADNDDVHESLQRQIDELSETKGDVMQFQVHNIVNGVTTRAGELATNAELAADVTWLSMASVDVNENVTEQVSDQDIIEVGSARYVVTDASSQPSSMTVMYVSGDQVFTIAEQLAVYCFPQNTTTASQAELEKEIANRVDSEKVINLDVSLVDVRVTTIEGQYATKDLADNVTAGIDYRGQIAKGTNEAPDLKQGQLYFNTVTKKLLIGA